MIASVYPAIQVFGRSKAPAPVATPTLLPANATEADILSSMMGAGLHKSLVGLIALVVLGVFVVWAWGQIRGD
jgi:hypothetical protein